PAAWLRQAGIEPVHPIEGVGRNYQDHLQVRLVFRATRPITFNDQLRSWHGQLRAGLRYALFHKGPLTVSAGYAGGFFRTPLARDGRPDMECHFITFSLDQMGERFHAFPGFTASSCQLRPDSRGEIRAVAPGPPVPPACLAHFTSDQTDRP